MSASQQKNIDYKDSTLHYSLAGQGFPVMFVHGFAEDGSVWDNQVAALKDKYLLIIPDLPGSGNSTFLQKDRITLEDYAAALKAMLDHEGIDRCIMIGHSMGGYITLAFAEMYKESLVAFGLFHSSAYADDAEKIATRKKAIDFIKNNSANAFLQTAIPGLFFDTEKSKSHIDSLLKKGNNFTQQALIQYYEAMIGRPDRTELLKTTECPVLMIIGQHDKAVPFKLGLEQAKMPAHSYIHILRSSAHMGMLEETETANVFLADFLQNNEVK